MNQATFKNHRKAVRMPDIDPWVIDCAYDELMCRSQVDCKRNA